MKTVLLKLLAGNSLISKIKNLPSYLDWSQMKTPSEMPASEIKKIVNGSVVTWEGTYQGKPIRVRIFNEQTMDK